MTAIVSTLQRHRDPSDVSGTGPVATVCEFDSGLTVLHWDTATPSVTVYTDVRHVLNLHGHQGASELVTSETKLEQAYRIVMPYLLAGGNNPFQCGPHPDHPDRLRLVFHNETDWRRWIALFDGSTFAASHVHTGSEVQHSWIATDGLVWLVYHSPLPSPTNEVHDPRN